MIRLNLLKTLIFEWFNSSTLLERYHPTVGDSEQAEVGQAKADMMCIQFSGGGLLKLGSYDNFADVGFILR